MIVLPVGRDPAAVTNALVTAIGSPSHFGGVTAWLNVPHLLKTVAPTKSFRINVSPPWTTLLKPEMGAQIDGRQGLIASASSVFGVRSVDFELSGTNLFVRNICRAVPFQYGWICGWNTATVPNGMYTVRSVVTDVVGQVTRSSGVVVHVQKIELCGQADQIECHGERSPLSLSEGLEPGRPCASALGAPWFDRNPAPSSAPSARSRRG